MNVDRNEGLATITLSRGKVNAIDRGMMDELRTALEDLQHDAGTNAVILTGSGKFFSFGFDVPALLSFTKEQFTDFVGAFTALYTDLFAYPKPILAAINGHAVAGGCMLALACDHRVMARGNARISLNEITFGASVFAGIVEILRFWVGSANATSILTSGAMYSAEEAVALGLVHEATDENLVLARAMNAAAAFGAKRPAALASMRSLLRRPALEEMRRREQDSIREFVEIWYSDPTWNNLRNITIR